MHNRPAYDMIHNPRLNKGTAYTAQERKALHIEGLIPPAVEDLDRQIARVVAQMDAASSDLHRYTLLRSVQDRNSTLYYAVLLSDPERFLPIVYTPTVGEACIKFGHILRRSRGLYLPSTAACSARGSSRMGAAAVAAVVQRSVCLNASSLAAISLPSPFDSSAPVETRGQISNRAVQFGGRCPAPPRPARC